MFEWSAEGVFKPFTLNSNHLLTQNPSTPKQKHKFVFIKDLTFLFPILSAKSIVEMTIHSKYFGFHSPCLLGKTSNKLLTTNIFLF